MEKRAGLWAVIAVSLVLATVGGYMRYNDRRTAEGDDTLQALLGPELGKVAAHRQTWDVDFRPWIGREAGDFVVTDIEGTAHRLSDYRGKEVAVVFWATWCPACNAEIPHLIELRSKVGPEKLAILAVSNEAADVLRPFAEAKGINYTVASVGSELPEPFSAVERIPTTFFIDAGGKVKLAAMGLVPLEDSVAIVNAGV